MALTLPDELVLTLLNEESGYFRQVSGWVLDCAIVGSALAELSLQERIDTDLESLILLDDTPTKDPCLDPILAEITSIKAKRSTQYWIERLAPRAEGIIDIVLDRLVELKILQHHDGDFWSLAQTVWMSGHHTGSELGTAVEFVKTRISKTIFNDEIPDPRDIIIICLVETCNVLRYIFELDEEAEERVQQVIKMDLIGRSISNAVHENIARPSFKRTSLGKKIPVVPIRKILRCKSFRSGNLSPILAELSKEYGPVFRINPPFGEKMIFLAGPETNHWVHRHGRNYLGSRDYLVEFEKLYGGSGILPALDGADHFRYRKSAQPGYARSRLESQIDACLAYTRKELQGWEVGKKYQAVDLCRRLVNSAMSPLSVSLETQEMIKDMCDYKARALQTHVARSLPKFLLKTPSMRRKGKRIGEVTEKILNSHTPAQRSDCPRDLIDELLSMHSADRQFLPEANFSFLFSAPLLAAMYMGDEISFIVHEMVTRPEFHAQICSEADAIFANGNSTSSNGSPTTTNGSPTSADFTGPATDITKRFIMECLRLYPTVPVSIRNVRNPFTLEGYELPLGARIGVATTSAHYMDELFPDPHKFDIDRYKAPRKEHLGTAYAPYGLGTHTCLGSRWVELHMTILLLLIAHHVSLEISPKNYQLKVNPFPSQSPRRKLKFMVTGVRNDFPPDDGAAKASCHGADRELQQ